MERFRKYLGKNIDWEHIQDKAMIRSYGISCRHIPDPPEDFDEFEFVLAWDEHEPLAIMVTVEHMKISRIFWGLFSPDAPDDIRALSEAQQKELLEKKGELLVQFFDFIIQD